jgi:hypothetical protein
MNFINLRKLFAHNLLEDDKMGGTCSTNGDNESILVT